MATTTQCLNTLRLEPLASSRASSILNAGRALSPSGSYSDTETLNEPPSASGAPAEAQYPREPLTEFQIGAGAAGLLIGLCAAFTLAGLERMRENPESAIKLDHIRGVFSLKRMWASHR